MIICGYPGIGKSQFCKDYKDIGVDPDSSQYAKGEESKYVADAVKFSKEGYVVFVSTHPNVIQKVKDSGEFYVIIYPSLKLKDEWVERLKSRYEHSKLEPDRRAYERARDYFEDDINNIQNNNENLIQLTTMSYRLDSIVEGALAIFVEDYQ